MKAKLAADKTFGEANLRGHLKNPNDETTPEGKELKETSGSSAFVPEEPEKDTQLQYALSFLRGTTTEAKTAGNPVRAPETATRAVPN